MRTIVDKGASNGPSVRVGALPQQVSNEGSTTAVLRLDRGPSIDKGFPFTLRSVGLVEKNYILY